VVIHEAFLEMVQFITVELVVKRKIDLCTLEAFPSTTLKTIDVG
jgi:hypothetical protein